MTARPDRYLIGVPPFRQSDITAYPTQAAAFAAEDDLCRRGIDYQFVVTAGTITEVAREMRADHARKQSQLRAASLPICAGCGAGLISLDDDRTPPSERTRWADDNRFDGPHNTAQDCDGTESGVHEPAAAVSA